MTLNRLHGAISWGAGRIFPWGNILPIRTSSEIAWRECSGPDWGFSTVTVTLDSGLAPTASFAAEPTASLPGIPP